MSKPAAEIEIIIDPKNGTTEWETHNIASDETCNKMLKVFQRGNEVLGEEVTGGECLELPDYEEVHSE